MQKTTSLSALEPIIISNSIITDANYTSTPQGPYKHQRHFLRAIISQIQFFPTQERILNFNNNKPHESKTLKKMKI